MQQLITQSVFYLNKLTCLDLNAYCEEHHMQQNIILKK